MRALPPATTQRQHARCSQIPFPDATVESPTQRDCPDGQQAPWPRARFFDIARRPRCDDPRVKRPSAYHRVFAPDESLRGRWPRLCFVPVARIIFVVGVRAVTRDVRLQSVRRLSRPTADSARIAEQAGQPFLATCFLNRQYREAALAYASGCAARNASP